jgi:hypothetical protein
MATRKDNYKPTRTNAGHDVGGGGRSILADVERVSRTNSGRSATSLGGKRGW